MIVITKLATFGLVLLVGAFFWTWWELRKLEGK